MIDTVGQSVVTCGGFWHGLVRGHDFEDWSSLRFPVTVMNRHRCWYSGQRVCLLNTLRKNKKTRGDGSSPLVSALANLLPEWNYLVTITNGADAFTPDGDTVTSMV